MCAECHSTNVKKGYSAATKSYATTWSELDVSCEACHGPGSAHVAWAEAVKAGKARKDAADKGMAVTLQDPVRASWEMDMKTGIAKRSVPRTSRVEIETCARCHARRSVVSEEYVYGEPILQTHRPALLDEELYYADGQIQDEVYEYGSFLQSKMHAAGVTCTDCHDAHDLKVKGSADRVCARLPPDREVRVAEAPLSQGELDRSELRGLPHADPQLHGRPRAPRPQHAHSAAGPLALRSARRTPARNVTGTGRIAWAADAALKWWGDKVRQETHYGQIAHAGRQELDGAQAALAAFVADAARPAIRRGTAASLLDPRDKGSRAALARALADPEPLVRHGALEAAGALEPSERLRLVSPLLSDPIRTIRIQAAQVLTSFPREA